MVVTPFFSGTFFRKKSFSFISSKTDYFTTLTLTLRKNLFFTLLVLVQESTYRAKRFEKSTSNPAGLCSKLTTETLEQGAKYVQS